MTPVLDEWAVALRVGGCWLEAGRSETTEHPTVDGLDPDAYVAAFCGNWDCCGDHLCISKMQIADSHLRPNGVVTVGHMWYIFARVGPSATGPDHLAQCPRARNAIKVCTKAFEPVTCRDELTRKPLTADEKRDPEFGHFSGVDRRYQNGEEVVAFLLRSFVHRVHRTVTTECLDHVTTFPAESPHRYAATGS